MTSGELCGQSLQKVNSPQNPASLKKCVDLIAASSAMKSLTLDIRLAQVKHCFPTPLLLMFVKNTRCYEKDSKK